MMDDEMMSAIRAILADQDAAWAAGDAAAFGARCLPDVVFTNVVGMFSIGIAPFNAQHERIFATFYKGSTMRQEIVHVAVPVADVAIVDSLTSVTNFVAAPPGAEAIDGALRTRLEQVMVRRDDGWRIASFHNVAVHPAAMAPPPR